jgi:hypothetical protein
VVKNSLLTIPKPVRFLVKLALLLFVSIRLFGGSYFISLLVKEFHKELFVEKCKRGYTSEQMKCLILSAASSPKIKWLTRDEFLLNGVIQDVVRADTTSGQTIVIYYISDDSETRTLQVLDNDTGEEKEPQKKDQKKNLMDDFLIESPLAIAYKKPHFSHSTYFFVKDPLDFITPLFLPPRLV